MSWSLLIPDGIGVRNFLLGRFLAQSSALENIHALHTIPEHLLVTYNSELDAARVQWQQLLPYKEKPLTYTLRNSLAYAHMYWADTPGMRFNSKREVTGSPRTQAVHMAARVIGHAAANPRGMERLDRWHRKEAGQVPEVERYRQVFKEHGTGLLFSSHQWLPEIVPPVMAAHSLGIPTVTSIANWNNLASKGRMSAHFDYFLVWSEQMKSELLRYYPEVQPDHIYVVGAPQYDPYADPGLLWSREEFFWMLGADPERPLVCYTGGDKRTCPEDQRHVAALMRLIRTGQVKGDPQVALRPAPMDEGSRYTDVRHYYPELIYCRPRWTHTRAGDWARVLPHPEDTQFLVNLLYHSDVNVNIASTMTLDFSIFDKPVVNIAYDISTPPPLGKPLRELFYQFEHWRPVTDLGASRMATNSQELAELINMYLAHPEHDREGRARLVQTEIGYPLGQSTSRVIEMLSTIAGLEATRQPRVESLQLVT